MAKIESPVTVKAVEKVVIPPSTEATTYTVKNASGGQTVTLSRNEGVVAGKGFDLAAAASVTVALREGQALYGICGAAKETTVEVL